MELGEVPDDLATVRAPYEARLFSMWGCPPFGGKYSPKIDKAGHTPSMSKGARSTTQEALLSATARIFRPLVRILLRNGVACNAVTEVVRRAFVDVANAEFGLQGKPPTQARISVLTGLHRKEVSRLLKEQGTDVLPPEARRNRAASVLGAWLRDPEFHDELGQPRPLPLSGEGSFADLCKRHSGDMKPGSIADELLAAGALEKADGKLRMTSRGYVPGKDPVEILRILGTDTAELIDVIDHNLRATEPNTRRYQSKVMYDRVPAECRDEFLRYSAVRAQALLEDLDRWLSERDLGDHPTAGISTLGLGLGTFQIVTESPAEQPTATTDSGEPAAPTSDDE